jgi:hypothetical protein
MNSKMTVSKQQKQKPTQEKRKRKPMTETAKTKMLEKRKITIETKRLHETFNPDSELHRKKILENISKLRQKQDDLEEETEKKRKRWRKRNIATLDGFLQGDIKKTTQNKTQHNIHTHTYTIRL